MRAQSSSERRIDDWRGPLRPLEMGHYYDLRSYPPRGAGQTLRRRLRSCAHRGDLPHQSGPQAGDLRTFLRRVRLWIMKILVIGSPRRGANS